MQIAIGSIANIASDSVYIVALRCREAVRELPRNLAYQDTPLFLQSLLSKSTRMATAAWLIVEPLNSTFQHLPDPSSTFQNLPLPMVCHVMLLPCQWHVNITLMSCRWYVNVMLMSCRWHVDGMSISCWCRVDSDSMRHDVVAVLMSPPATPNDSRWQVP